MGTVSVPSCTLCLISGVANGDICFFGQKETGAERLRVSFCFFCDAHLWCHVSRTLSTSIFPKISFIQYFTIFSCKQYDVITNLICILEKRQYL